MSLQDKLDALKAKFETEMAPPESPLFASANGQPRNLCPNSCWQRLFLR
jgi:hypothetical protein